MSLNRKEADGSTTQVAGIPFVTKENIGLGKVENKSPEELVEMSKSILTYSTPQDFGAVGDGEHDDTEAFKDCVSNALTSKMKIVVPLGIYKITDTLVIDGRVNIEGISREATVLDFSAMSADKTAIQYCKESGSSFCTLKNMTIKGNQTITAIYISGAGQKSLVDSVFENLYIDNFKLGLKSAWCWCLSFRDIRFNGCINGLLLESQTNNILFDRVSAVNITERCVDLVNCEGLQFNSCEFANAKNGVRLWQSWAVMNNPYFENISDTALMPGYTTGYARLSVVGGKIEGKLHMAQKDSSVDIRSATITAGRYPLKVITMHDTNTPCVMAKHLYIDGAANNLIQSYEAGYEEVPFATEPYTLTQHENYASFYSSAGGFRFQNLEVGKQYTLAINMRNTHNTAITMTIIGKTAVNMEANFKDNEFKEYYMPFIAYGEALAVTMRNTVDLKSVKLYEGIYTGE